MQVWCDCRVNLAPSKVNAVFDKILSNESNTSFCLVDDKLIEDGSTTGQLFSVKDSNTYEIVRGKIGLLNWIILEFSSWKMIPVENLISECEGTGTSIAVIVTEEKDVNGIAFALEKGVGAIVIENETSLIQACEIAKSQRLESQNNVIEIVEDSLSELQLTTSKITKIESGGTGERYCIDLTCLISHAEGMLIGSSSSSLALVHGEVLESEFVPSRPFRVNAGPPHSYILMANGNTKYLSELISGDEVLLVSENGSTRSAIIGRLKIEKRPFLRIYWENDYQISNSIFLQQAETVRILSRVGEVKSVTDLKTGDSILCHHSNHTRHIGNKVSIHSKEV